MLQARAHGIRYKAPYVSDARVQVPNNWRKDAMPVIFNREFLDS